MAQRKVEAKPAIIPSEKFIIPRNDPLDKFKPNSDDAVQILATTPIRERLAQDDVAMLREIAAEMDMSLPFTAVEDFQMRATISEECRVQLARLPTWLGSMIRSRWDAIHKHYGHNAHKFLKVIANRIENQYRNQYLKAIGTTWVEDEEQVKEEEVYEGYELLRGGAGKAATDTDEKKGPVSAFRMAQVFGKFQSQQKRKKYWDPVTIQRAERCLRTAMVTRATVTDVALLQEEEKEADEIINKNDEYEYDSEEDLQGSDGKTKHVHRGGWEIVDEGNVLKKEAKIAIEMEYHERNEIKLSNEEKEKQKMKKKMQKVDKRNGKVGCWSYMKGHPLFVATSVRKRKKKNLLERALHRRYSRIWYTGCGDPIENKKVGHQFRLDEGFHEYVVSLVTWTPFKFLIMFIILANAFLLAFETQTNESKERFEEVYEYLDNFFLSAYTVEFILKIYAHPYKYWKSGYNVFDFIILMLSLLKMVVDWMRVVTPEDSFLRFLLILRALRILRGISMSIQLQVLVTALVETVRTHVLSVVILLVLIMYIAAVAAHYLFGEKVKDPWANVALGMLRMFSFVTMDGWTDITRDFEKADMLFIGRLFGLTGIVLGNFLFSSIFIAIIIMNIAEATDAHRVKSHFI